MVTAEHARALTSLALFAAFADGEKNDHERARVKEVVEGLGNVNMTEAMRRVLMKQTSVSQEAAVLDTPELRSLAWESALVVCEADGMTSAAERRFLDELATALGRSVEVAHREVADADALHQPAVVENAAPPPLPVLARDAAAPLASSASARAADPRHAQVESTVLKYAILTAAVELLPQNLATLAIIPLQTKMVYGVGKTYGHALSAASIKEFIAAIGVGMTGQVVEQYARKLLGRFGSKILGGMGKTAAQWGTGPALTFATTYAMGMVSRQYYAGGRSLSALDLKTLFSQQVEQAKGLYQRYEPQIRETAATTDPRQLLNSLRGA